MKRYAYFTVYFVLTLFIATSCSNEIDMQAYAENALRNTVVQNKLEKWIEQNVHKNLDETKIVGIEDSYAVYLVNNEMPTDLFGKELQVAEVNLRKKNGQAYMVKIYFDNSRSAVIYALKPTGDYLYNTDISSATWINSKLGLFTPVDGGRF